MLLLLIEVTLLEMKYLNYREKLGGVDIVVQIDKSLFRKKYHRRMLLLGDVIDSTPDHNSR